MKNAIFAAGLAAAAISFAPLSASAGGLKAPGGDTPFRITSAQLAIKSPATNACPTKAKMTGWIMTNKPGKVSYMLVRQGGSVAGPYTLDAVPAANGGGMASFTRMLNIDTAIDTQYRILLSDGTGRGSNWAPLRASCKIKLGG